MRPCYGRLASRRLSCLLLTQTLAFAASMGIVFARGAHSDGNPQLNRARTDSFSSKRTDVTQPHTPSSERRVYLVPLGALRGVSLNSLAEYYSRRFEIAVKVMPALALPSSAWDSYRDQWIAGELIERMRAGGRRIRNDPKAILIGVTAGDMYMRRSHGQFAFALREDGRFAVVSIARMDPANFGLPADDRLLRARLRKMITKNIEILCFHLSLSGDPQSVLYDNIASVDDLDRINRNYGGSPSQ